MSVVPAVRSRTSACADVTTLADPAPRQQRRPDQAYLAAGDLRAATPAAITATVRDQQVALRISVPPGT
jgi:hypothetical protein